MFTNKSKRKNTLLAEYCSNLEQSEPELIGPVECGAIQYCVAPAVSNRRALFRVFLPARHISRGHRLPYFEMWQRPTRSKVAMIARRIRSSIIGPRDWRDIWPCTRRRMAIWRPLARLLNSCKTMAPRKKAPNEWLPGNQQDRSGHGEPNATTDVKPAGRPIGLVWFADRERGNGATTGPFQTTPNVTRFPIFGIEERAG